MDPVVHNPDRAGRRLPIIRHCLAHGDNTVNGVPDEEALQRREHAEETMTVHRAMKMEEDFDVG